MSAQRKGERVSHMLGLFIGGLVGASVFTFHYAKGTSYLSDNPEACANCHVMNQHLDAWSKSSHHGVATCNDCHTPHAWLEKYWTKARNGYHHSVAFTKGGFLEPIQITEANRRITEASCRNCHSDMVQMIDRHGIGSNMMSCLRCHNDVGHSR